jgi:hypothetical protein
MFSYTEILPVAAHFDWFTFFGALSGGSLVALLITLFLTLAFEDFLPRVFETVFIVLLCVVGFISVQIADKPAKVPENIKYTATYEHLESVRSGKHRYATKIVYRLETGDLVMMPYSDGQVINKTTTLYYNK